MKRSESVANLRKQYEILHSSIYNILDPARELPIKGIYKVIRVLGNCDKAFNDTMKVVCNWKEDQDDLFFDEFELTIDLKCLIDDCKNPKDDWFNNNNIDQRRFFLWDNISYYNLRINKVDSSCIEWDFFNKNNNINFSMNLKGQAPMVQHPLFDLENNSNNEVPKIYVTSNEAMNYFKNLYPGHEIILVSEREIFDTESFKYFEEYSKLCERFGKLNAKTIPVPGIYRINFVYMIQSDLGFDNGVKFLGKANYLREVVDQEYVFDTSFSVVIRLNSLANINSSNPTLNIDLLNNLSFRRDSSVNFPKLLVDVCKYFFIRINDIQLEKGSYCVDWDLIQVVELAKCD